MTDDKNHNNKILGDINAIFQQAATHFQQGRLSEATTLAQKVLDANPNHADANHLLSIIAGQRGNFVLADQLITHAIKSNPDAAMYYSTRATILLQSKRLEEAVASCEKAIVINPHAADVYNSLGFILNELGRTMEALSACDRAIQLQPDFGAAHTNRGSILGAMGRTEEALLAFEHAIMIQPLSAEAHNNCGLALQKLGKPEEAIKSYDKVTQLMPDNAEAYYSRGLVLQELGQDEEAVRSHDKAIQLKPEFAEAYCSRGLALQELGQNNEAVRSHDKAIQLKSDFAEAYCNRGLALQELGQIEESLRNYDKAIQLKPDYADAYNNRGYALQAPEQLEEAVRCFDKAIQLKPDFAEAFSNRGSVYQALGHTEEAVKNYDKAIQLKPDYAGAHLNLSFTLLLLGNFKDGLREYEWRWKDKVFTSKNRNFVQPQWDGSPMKGKTILLHAEQGAGDSIHFIRYVKEVAKYNGKVIFKCQRSLVRLFSTLSEIDLIIYDGETIPAFDVHAPLLSLPYIFKTHIDTIPAIVPYLFAVEHDQLPQLSTTRLNIGIVWAGSPTHKNDRNRSTSLSSFLTLVSVPGIQLFSLQLGDHRKDLANIVDDSSIIDLTESIHDYADTAGIIAQLDLVISVDTSVAHLAGAMGKPTWVILPYMPDFRWLLGRDNSPWYPTMKLFRQEVCGNWSQVFSKIKNELSNYSRLNKGTLISL